MKNDMLRRFLSLILALAVCLSLPLAAFADTVDVETTKGNTESVDVTIIIESSSTPDGGTHVRTDTVADNAVTESGMIVNYQGSSDMTTDADGYTTGSAQTAYTVTNHNGTYGAAGGSNMEQSRVAPEVSVDVPLSEGETNTVSGDAEDQGNTTVVSQGSASVSTESILTESLTDGDLMHGYGSDLDYIRTEVSPDADNDLFKETASLAQLPGSEEEIPELTEGYDYIYLGSENSSEYFAALLYTTPRYEGEEPLYTINGVDYYSGRSGMSRTEIEQFEATNKGIHAGFVHDDIYVNGKRLTEDEDVSANGKYVMIWGAVQQFVLIDAESGELITTYCADSTTYTQEGYSYNIENVEDADYYTEEQAAMIRTVAQNGYWGTESGTGSLEAMREMMRGAQDAQGNAVFTEEEIQEILTDGVAMTATQYAIWTFSNEMDDIAFLGVNYINSGDTQEKKATSYAAMGDVPAEKKAAADLIFKLYDYLIHLEPSAIDEPSTGNTVITADNMLKDLSVTVIEKAEDHANNQDADNNNDAYVTDLSFALVVMPSTENGDDMIVKIVSNGQVLKEARIAGNPKDGETLETLVCDGNGNYTISGITLTEGNQEFNITLEGVQNLEQGIYLYTSEIRDIEDEEISSQTMVGMAGGEHAVNVSMTVSFDLDVHDQVVATENVWREEWTNPGNPQPHDPGPYPIVPYNDDGDIIPDEPVPLADVPKTGDGSLILAALAVVSALGMGGLQLSKKREEG